MAARDSGPSPACVPKTGKADGAFEADYYAKYYRDYERQNPARKLQHYIDAVRSSLPEIAAPKILDVGCAFGRFVAALDPAWERYGADVSEHAITWARDNVEGAHFAVIGDRAIPFADRFDAITAWDVIEHVPDLEAIAGEIGEHLNPGGSFVFVVPVYDGPLGPVVRALDADPTHIHKRSRRFWVDWAGRHFEVERWWGVFRYLLPSGPYLHVPSRALRGIAPAILVVARNRARP